MRGRSKNHQPLEMTRGPHSLAACLAI